MLFYKPIHSRENYTDGDIIAKLNKLVNVLNQLHFSSTLLSYSNTITTSLQSIINQLDSYRFTRTIVPIYTDTFSQINAVINRINSYNFLAPLSEL